MARKIMKVSKKPKKQKRAKPSPLPYYMDRNQVWVYVHGFWLPMGINPNM